MPQLLDVVAGAPIHIPILLWENGVLLVRLKVTKLHALQVLVAESLRRHRFNKQFAVRVTVRVKLFFHPLG